MFTKCFSKHLTTAKKVLLLLGNCPIVDEESIFQKNLFKNSKLFLTGGKNLFV